MTARGAVAFVHSLERRIVATVAVIAVAAYCWVYTRADADPPIHSDGFNYYVYAPSWLVYHDVSLDALSNDWFGGAYPNFTGMIRWPGSSRWLNRLPIGVATMMMPFVVAADRLTRWSNFPRDGFSLYYQHAAGLSGLAYFVVGLAFLRATLRRHFGRGATLAGLVVITFGTDLFHYAVYDSTFSHAFSFALVAALVDVTDRWSASRHTWQIVLLGVVAGLVVLVRHTNAVFLLLIPLWTPGAAFASPRRRDLATIAAIAFACTLPQHAYYRWITGSWIVNPYASTGLHLSLASPHVFGVLFSTQRGLFFWAPALTLCVAGLFVPHAWTRGRLAAIGIVLLLDVWVVASWSEWQYGASFGQRALIDAFPLMAVLAAAFFDWSASKPPAVAGSVAAFALVATLLCVAQTWQYWLHIWPARDITWDQYRALFLTFR